MSLFAKTAADALYDDELGEEPQDKVPAWKRALPWVAGLGGAAGLGYLTYKGLQPAEKPMPGHAAMDMLSVPGQLINSVGSTADGALLTGAATGGASGIKDYNKVLDDRELTQKALHQRMTDTAAKPNTWFDNLVRREPAYNKEELNRVGTNMDKAMAGTSQSPAGQAPLNKPGAVGNIMDAITSHFKGESNVHDISKILKAESEAGLRGEPTPNLTALETLTGKKIYGPDLSTNYANAVRHGTAYGNGTEYGRIGGRALQRGLVGALAAAGLGAEAQGWEQLRK